MYSVNVNILAFCNATACSSSNEIMKSCKLRSLLELIVSDDIAICKADCSFFYCCSCYCYCCCWNRIKVVYESFSSSSRNSRGTTSFNSSTAAAAGQVALKEGQLLSIAIVVSCQFLSSLPPSSSCTLFSSLDSSFFISSGQTPDDQRQPCKNVFLD